MLRLVSLTSMILRSLSIVHILYLIVLQKPETRLRFKQYDDEADYQRDGKLLTWSLLNMFAGWEVHNYLRGNKIDSLDNLIILQKDHHSRFGAMNLWFVETPVLLCQPAHADDSLAGRNIHYSHAYREIWVRARPACHQHQ
jgi:hypothetical protein